MTHPAQLPIPYEPGTRVGLVTVLRKAPSKGTGARWWVRCRCGDERIVTGANLRRWPFTSHQGCKRWNESEAAE